MATKTFRVKGSSSLVSKPHKGVHMVDLETVLRDVAAPPGATRRRAVRALLTAAQDIPEEKVSAVAQAVLAIPWDRQPDSDVKDLASVLAILGEIYGGHPDLSQARAALLSILLGRIPGGSDAFGGNFALACLLAGFQAPPVADLLDRVELLLPGAQSEPYAVTSVEFLAEIASRTSDPELRRRAGALADRFVEAAAGSTQVREAREEMRRLEDC